MKLPWKKIWRLPGAAGMAFCIVLVAYLAMLLASPGSLLISLLGLALIVLGLWLAIRMARMGMRKVIWRLRNRLLVTYLFIAVVPVVLIAALALYGAYFLLGQLAVYLAISDLERRVGALGDIAEALASTQVNDRPAVVPKVAETHQRRFPNLSVIARTGDSIQIWPGDASQESPPEYGETSKGVVIRRGRYFLWSHASRGATRVTVLVPLTRAYLSRMIPGLGDVSLIGISGARNPPGTGSGSQASDPQSSRELPANPLPPAANTFDRELEWFSTILVWKWDHPAEPQLTLLYVHTRPSAVLGAIFNTRMDQVIEIRLGLLLGLAILFCLVEIGALAIGVSLTRTITRAVKTLYDGTRRVTKGDFSQRIAISGNDQLAELGSSFNAMTENLERLLKVAKEKERLQAEVEIARQVQEQLYPKVTPNLRTLRLTATCWPARMVSGDYYDYLCVSSELAALAIGDVAGKGISAALLMASIQSAMRMELRSTRSAGSNGAPVARPSASRLVSDLNQQLWATTSSEKYATFFFALYDDSTGELNYTNAGHLPPVLVRNGSATLLEVTGTVVGAFQNAKYEEQCVRLQEGDLLLCYTDGITEPENEYGEMFGEERLIDLVIRNADCEDSEIVAKILEAVRQWTSAAEQPDDMTLLLARRP